jgi:thiol:disulfide interchange protein DsbD
VGGSASGARRAFFEGLLAVALATPCSAPFLGTALGFAFAGPALLIVAVFLAIGAGLSAPFLALSAFPRFARFMPRSGAWMGIVRSGLGFALLATVVWLLWVVGRGAGVDGVVALLGVLLAGSFVAWVYGRVQYAGLPGAAVGAALAVAALVVGGANLVRVSASAQAPAAQAPTRGEPGGREAWSEARLASARASGRPVFVYFTADWCLTCKLNERIALHTDATGAALAAGGFQVLRGDWTQRDEAIRRELARHGKAGVPLYLVYAPGRERPDVLPELLTQERLLAALADAAK